MTATAACPVAEIGMEDIESILRRAETGPLTEDERKQIHDLAVSYLAVLNAMKDQKATIGRLRRLVFGPKTESKENVTGEREEKEKQKEKTNADREGGEGEAAEKEKKKRKGHGRIPASDYTGAETVKVPHESLAHKDPCPHCGGRVYQQQQPAVLVRIRGCAPLAATVYEKDRLRCNLCQEVFTAASPEGVGEEKYDETVASMIALLRYGSGFPHERLAELQRVTGVPLPASMQWELVSDASKKLSPVLMELLRQGAQGRLVMNDDTPMRILDFLVEVRKLKERGEKPPDRTGIFTSGIVCEIEGGRKIVLYFTGRRHAGENLARLLLQRESGLDPPQQMCDGLDRNVPANLKIPGSTEVPERLKTLLGNCMAHARRKYVEVAESFPAEVRHVIDRLAIVYRNDARAREEEMSPAERLALHQEESGPVMDELKGWLEARVEEKKVEPNSSLGKAIAYTLGRWEPLTLFLRLEGAPLDNNLCERILKRAILHRKNSLFYKTQNGARVGDLYMSLIATAKLANVDPFDYLNALQRHAKEVAAAPADWMPWSYRETIARSSLSA